MDDIMSAAITVVIVLFLSLGGCAWRGVSCANKAKLMGMRFDFGITTGCMIEPKPGQWINIDKYRVIE